jgi:putative hydrolase of HD superfamily
MIRKAFILKLFDAAFMQRWNDKIRPVELLELDKQAHKMIIAYVLGKCEEENQRINWIEIIEGGLFELLQRLVITDIKPQIFYKIKDDPNKYEQLNQWVYRELEHIILPIGRNYTKKFKKYFAREQPDYASNIERKIISAAHFYATKWEFEIIEHENPKDYELPSIKESIESDLLPYKELKGIQKLAKDKNLRKFIDLCGMLRFQIRWSHLYRIPRTSVLGHMLITAILAFLLSVEANACKARRVNNYLTGLFHDLPEVLTRDISSPVKKSSPEMENLIEEYEKEQMEKEVYNLLPIEWHSELRMFTEDVFKNIINGKQQNVSSAEITTKYNRKEFNPRDGEIVKAADDLAAFTEAYLSLENGINSEKLSSAKYQYKEKYISKIIAGINFGEIYADF